MPPVSTSASTTSETPDRPVLAPGTWLVGQLAESALENPPWAVERAKVGYVQMGELAYRVAEQADGEQTVDEIATAVSVVLRRSVSTQDVEALIHTVLIPRGVVLGPNGVAHAEQEDRDDGLENEGTLPGSAAIFAASSPHPRSYPVVAGLDTRRSGQDGRAPRGQRPREVVVGPQRLEAIASVAMWLFWPPIFLALTAISVAALIWLYAIHGLAASVVQALAVPVVLPFVLLLAGLAVVTDVVGPMAALYSAGASLERLRIAPRLPLPSWELDADNDYGFSRWARLMVNLGGAYLGLVLCLLLCLLGRALGAEFLFLTVALLTLHVLWKLLPFGRAGADRLLADLLLVSEPLAYAEQAISRYLPSSMPRELPPLKPWGRLTIMVYLLASGLLLLYVGLALLWVTPPLLATTLAALRAYLGGMIEAVGERDALGFVGSAFKLGLLGVMSFSLAVAGIVGAWQAVSALLAWMRVSPRRRLVGSVGAALALVLMLAFWLPVNAASALVREGRAAPRSLAGAVWASLTPFSRGALADLFDAPAEPGSSVAEPQDGAEDGSPAHPAGSPVVNANIGSGPVDGALPGATSAAGGGGGGGGGGAGGAAVSGGDTGPSGAAGTSGNAAAGATGAGPTTGPAAKPAATRDETPAVSGSGNGSSTGTGTGTAGAPTAGTNGATGPNGASAGQATSAPAAAPAARGTTAPSVAPAQRAIAAPNNGATTTPNNGGAAGPNGGAAGAATSAPNAQPAAQPASQPTARTAAQPTSPSASQPASQPGQTVNTAPTQAAPSAARPTVGPSNSVTVNGSSARPTPLPNTTPGTDDNEDEIATPGTTPTPG
ncbi:MAG: hypothetical protein U0893_16200 [Chloroflexota bacterium]